MADQPPEQPPNPAAPPSPPSPLASPPAGGYPMVARTDGMAIAALVVGVIGVVAILGFGAAAVLLGVAAIVLGVLARRRIGESRGALAGGGLATAGWILGLVAVAGGGFTAIALYLVMSNFLT